MEREVGGGIGMGKTCEPKAFSFQCMTKFTTNKKKKKEKKKNSYMHVKYKIKHSQNFRIEERLNVNENMHHFLMLFGKRII